MPSRLEVVYVPAWELDELWERREAGWSVHGERRSVRLGGKIYKRLFAEPDELSEFREALRSKLNVRRAPSGWADAYHAAFGKEWPNRSYLAAAPRACYGPWEERRLQSPPAGAGQFDLTAAYGWAGACRPLPDARRVRPSRGEHTRHPRPGEVGLWLGIWRPGGVVLPPHLRRPWDDDSEEYLDSRRMVWASNEEIERLDLSPVRVKYGIVYEGERSDVARNLGELRERLPKFWKRIARSYWGIWAAQEGPECWNRERMTHVLPNPFREPGIAHFIESRVRIRMADVAREAALIYVDAVVTAARIRCGSAEGDWRRVPMGPAAARAFGGGKTR